MKKVKQMARWEITRELEDVYGVAVYDDENTQDLVECLLECRYGDSDYEEN